LKRIVVVKHVCSLLHYEQYLLGVVCLQGCFDTILVRNNIFFQEISIPFPGLLLFDLQCYKLQRQCIPVMFMQQSTRFFLGFIVSSKDEGE